MKICTVYSDVSDKIKSVVFAKKIAEEEARRKKIVAICVCAGVAVIAAAVAVAVYFLAKNEKVKAKVNEVVANVKSKLPCKKNADENCDCGFEECECDCEVTDAAAEE